MEQYHIEPCICILFFHVNVPEFTMCEKCPNTEFFWSVFSRIWTEYGDLLYISPYSVQMWENKDQKNSVFGQFFTQ